MPSKLVRSPRRENVRTSEVCSSVEHACELGPRTDPELCVDVRQVTGNGAFAEEQRGGDLSVRSSLGDESRDALLGRGQAFLAPSAADRPELRLGSFDPGRRAELLEPGDRLGD